MAGLTAGLIVWAGCTRHSVDPAVGALAASPAGYVGSAACAGCHAAECAKFRGSRHDTTLRTADRATLGPFSPPIGVVPLAGYSVAEKDGRFLLTREAVSPEALPLTMEMGSRKLGLTYLSVLADDTLMETKMSYFPPYKVWDVTPGQEARSPQDGVFGRTHTERESRNCVGCHATVVPAHGLVPEPRFRGVGCEACHGPGRAHVDAMKGGAHPANIRIGRMGLWKPTQINDLCGKCHRTAKDIDLSSPEVNLTQRFQPYALQRSTCRHRDGEPLSCMDCHSPHTNAGTDIKAYEAICLSCHSAASGTAGARHSANNGRQCPVNPTSGCIPCHMRSKPAFALTSMPAKMADHLISIAPKNRP